MNWGFCGITSSRARRPKGVGASGDPCGKRRATLVYINEAQDYFIVMEEGKYFQGVQLI
jgi:hypothetical protein